MTYRILNLFCCAGGSAKGYAKAGFEVVGVDIRPQPNYPHEFHRGDALEFVAKHWRDFHAVDASPPCQALTSASNRWRGKGGKADEHVNLIPETRQVLHDLGIPYVIENVPGASAWLHNPIVLRGGMFGLGVDRPRLFETTFPVPVPRCKPVRDAVGVYGALDGRRLTRDPRRDGTHQYAPKTLQQAREAMGIDWMEWEELREAIPPAYTRHIGKHLMFWLKHGHGMDEPMDLFAPLAQGV